MDKLMIVYAFFKLIGSFKTNTSLAC